MSEFSRSHGIKSMDVWLPLSVINGKRRKSSAVVAIAPSTPVALWHKETRAVLFDRQEILSQLHLLGITCVATMELCPDDVPEDYELFARWDKPPGTKLIPAGTTVFHRAVTSAQAVAEGSAVSLPEKVGNRRSQRAASLRESVTSESSALLMASRRRHEANAQNSNDDFDDRLRKAMPSMAAGPLSAVLQHVAKRICEWSHLPPLHRTADARHSAALVLPDGYTWLRPDSRLLLRTFRSKAEKENSRTALYHDGSRQLALFFVDGVLTPPPLLGTTETAALRTAAYLERLATYMQGYADRGYRVVLFDHYPTLHHGTRSVQEEKLLPIVEFCDAYMADRCSVTVLLSVLSSISATQTSDCGISFLLPNVGALNYFTSSPYNASLATDTKSSVVVGCSNRGSPFLDDIHRRFAANASLTFVEAAEVLATES